MVTSVNVDKLEELLLESGYHDIDYSVQGFREGFDLEYEGPVNRQDTSRNIPFTVGDKWELWNKVMKEVSLNRYAGPFRQIPFKNFVQSPIGLVPKAGNQTRLIFHLSYDFKESGHKSVNHYTPKHKCSVKYRDLDYAVQGCLRLLKLLKNRKDSKDNRIWFGKMDLKSAFRVLCLKPGVYWLLIMVAYHPVMGEKRYFVDKCLPFGHCMSCALFQRF